jgi:hypothetical protein
MDALIDLKSEGKIIGGGVPAGERALVLIFDAGSNEGLDTILRRLSGVAKWKITPLENLEGRASRDHHSLSNWSRVCRDKKHLLRSRTGPPEFSSRETCCDTSRKLVDRN